MNHQGTKNLFIIEILHIKRILIQYKSYLKSEIETRRLVHNKRMFILSDPDCIKITVDIGYSDSAGDREFLVKLSLYPISSVFLK